MRTGAVRTVLAVALLAGCVAAPAAEDEAPPASYAIAPPERLAFAMSDGVEVVATLWRPQGLDRAPVVLHAQPYASGCSMPGSAVFGDPYPQPCRPPTSDEFWLDEYHGAPRALVEAGFAFVDLNVRGTGESGGCLDMNGPREREDLGAVLDALATAEWSTGRIGMMGLSYMGTTPFVALGLRHPALEAVVAGGVYTNEYYGIYTPQGAGGSAAGFAFAPFWFGSVVGPQLGGGPEAAAGAAARQPERYCPEFLQGFGGAPARDATEERARDYFLDRRHSAHLRDVDAGVLVVQGVPDRLGLHWEPLWDALGDAPKAFVLGDWGHEFPASDKLARSDGLDWPALPLAWFDHFLRDGPAPATLGRAQHQLLGTDEWRTASAWPPGPSEAFYFDGASLAMAPGATDLAFRSVPQGAACGPDGTWALAMTDPLPADAVLAGNPMAWLQVELDAPTATIAVDLWEVPADDVCAGEVLAAGAADLRFLADPFRGSDAPVGEPIALRVDLQGVSSHVVAGHRLAVTFSSGGSFGVQGRPSEANVVVHAEGSHVLLPMASGLGAAPPAAAYPPMPVGHAWAPDG